MTKIEANSLGAVILAAGKGKRMNAKSVNKVAFNLAEKPMILHAIHLLQNSGVKKIIVVVGFAKDSVIKLLDQKITFVEQKKRLGTAHAVFCALQKMPANFKNILVVNGDDAAFYKKQTVNNLIKLHFLSDSSLTFLTIQSNSPTGSGRILRDKNDKVVGIVEEKDATKNQKRVKEINPACYIFKSDFLKKYLTKIKKNKLTGEYYLTELIKIAVENKEKFVAHRAGKISWRGVNTLEELKQAERIMLKKKNYGQI